MTIWGQNHQRLGTVKDFIVDYHEGCPTLFFAMAPELSGWSGGYVVVPFDAFQFGYDDRERTNTFTLGIAVDELRRAPHLEIDRWKSLDDRHFFNDARQFYRRVEHTAAKPGFDTERESGQRHEGDRPTLPNKREVQAPAPPQTKPPADSGRAVREQPAQPEHGAQPERKPQAEPATRPEHGSQPEQGGQPERNQRPERNAERAQRDQGARPQRQSALPEITPVPQKSSFGRPQLDRDI